jgi:Secretion system C-terminal sorting domain
MKSTFTTLLLLLMGLGVFAQQNNVISMQSRTLAPMPASASKVATVDTIWTYLDRSTAFYLLSAGASGYVLGTSDVSTETAMHYDGLGSTVVTDVIFFAAHKNILGGADSMMAHVYSSGMDSMPVNMVGMGTFSVADVDTTGFPNIVPVTATAVSGDFLVSVAYGGGVLDDTLVIMSNNPVSQGGGPDGAGEKRCRQLTNLGWLRAAEIWTIASAAFNADAIIIPIVDFTAVAIDDHVGRAGLALFPSYPNPAHTIHQIVWSTDATEDVLVNVYDLHGRTIATQSYSQMAAGKHIMSLATDTWAAGQYYFTVSTGKSSIGSKFVVQH